MMILGGTARIEFGIRKDAGKPKRLHGTSSSIGEGMPETTAAKVLK